jgi:hypothetical protein
MEFHEDSQIEPRLYEAEFFVEGERSSIEEVDRAISTYVDVLVDQAYDQIDLSPANLWHYSVQFIFYGFSYFPYSRVFLEDFTRIGTLLNMTPKAHQDARNAAILSSSGVASAKDALAKYTGQYMTWLDQNLCNELTDALKAHVAKPIPLMTLDRRATYLSEEKEAAKEIVRKFISPVESAVKTLIRAVFSEAILHQETYRPQSFIDTSDFRSGESAALDDFNQLLERFRNNKGADVLTTNSEDEEQDLSDQMNMSLSFIFLESQIMGCFKHHFERIEPDEDSRTKVMNSAEFLSAVDTFLDKAIAYQAYLSESLGKGVVQAGRRFELIAEEDLQFEEAIHHCYLSFFALHSQMFTTSKAAPATTPIPGLSSIVKALALDVALRSGVLRRPV